MQFETKKGNKLMKKSIMLFITAILVNNGYTQTLTDDMFSNYLSAQSNSHPSVSYDNYRRGPNQGQRNSFNVNAFIDLSRLDPSISRLIGNQLEAAERRNQAREFWESFERGVKSADSVLINHNQNSCDLLKQLESQTTGVPKTEAYVLGIKTRAPFCYIKNYFSHMDMLIKDLNSLEATLNKAKLKVTQITPDESESLAMFKEMESLTRNFYFKSLDTYKNEIEKAIHFNEGEIQSLKDSVLSLSNYINCPNLRSKLGTKFICDLKLAPAPLKLTIGDAYQILFQNKETGAFEEQLELTSLFRAAAFYKQEVMPSDRMVDYFAHMISSNLSRLDSLKTSKLSNTKTNALRDFSDNKEILWASQQVAMRKLLSEDLRDKLLDDLLAFKISIEDYKNFASTRYDNNTLNRMYYIYDRVLESYADISLTIDFPLKNVLIDLGDDIGTIQVAPVADKIGPIYLLGKNKKEVDTWLKYLKLNF